VSMSACFCVCVCVHVSVFIYGALSVMSFFIYMCVYVCTSASLYVWSHPTAPYRSCCCVFLHPEAIISPTDERARYATHENNPDDPRYVAYLGKFLNAVRPWLRAAGGGAAADAAGAAPPVTTSGGGETAGAVAPAAAAAAATAVASDAAAAACGAGAVGLDYGCGPGPTLSGLIQRAVGARMFLYDVYFVPRVVAHDDFAGALAAAAAAGTAVAGAAGRSAPGAGTAVAAAAAAAAGGGSAASSAPAAHAIAAAAAATAAAAAAADHAAVAPPALFDFVVSTETVEHFTNPWPCWLDMWSRVAPGGVLAVQTGFLPPLEKFKDWWYARDVTHVCFYSEAVMSAVARRLAADSVHFPGENCAVFVKAGRA
jgi:hypothetical protein